MTTRLLIHLCALGLTLLILVFLYKWTMDAFHPSPAEFSDWINKPWKPWARLAFSSIFAMLLLGAQLLLARRISA